MPWARVSDRPLQQIPYSWRSISSLGGVPELPLMALEVFGVDIPRSLDPVAVPLWIGPAKGEHPICFWGSNKACPIART